MSAFKELLGIVVGALALLVILPFCAALIACAWMLAKISPTPLLEPRYNTDRWEP